MAQAIACGVTVTPNGPSTSELLKQAIDQHLKGELQDAERLYRAILRAQPDHPDARHNLGALAVQVKQPADALQHFEAALRANPNQAQYWASYIVALIQTGRQDDARQALEAARQCGLNGDALLTLERQLMALPEPPARETGASPAMEQSRQLAALFNQGRHVEAEVLARALTGHYPDYGFGWKVLGACLSERGQAGAAVAALQTAEGLLPADAENHRNLGVALKRAGRAAEAEAAYRRALNINPDFAAALNDLGVVQQDDGRVAEAEASFRRALAIAPDFAGAHYNLGNILAAQREFQSAEASYRRAVAIDPAYAEAYNNLGGLALESGELEQAVAAYENAIRIRPDMAEAHKNMGHVLRYLDQPAKALSAYRHALRLDPAGVGLEAAVELAVEHYLAGDADQLTRMLAAAQPLMASTDHKHRPAAIYWEFLRRLDAWRRDSGYGRDQPAEMESLYVIGESHALSAHGVRVRHGDREMRGTAEWIPGCKQWHLGSGHANKYRHKFAAIMARLPRQSTVLLSIGEIDCRPDEGIISAWRKDPSRPLEEVAFATADAYVRYVAAMGVRHGHRLIIGGVPATNRQLNRLPPDEAERLVRLIGQFNRFLADLVLAAGLDFLDVHALTDRGDGIANGQWHIDTTHLHPLALTEAFGQHCRYATATRQTMARAPALQDVNTLAALYHQGRYVEAEAFARGLAEREPDRGFGWKVLGAVLLRQGRYAEALAPLRKAVELLPCDAEAFNSLGIVLKEHGRPSDAEATYRRALEIDPNCAQAHINLGAVLKTLGRLDDAVASYRRALALNPAYAEAYYNLGGALRCLGHVDDAVANYQRALALKPGYADAENNLGNALMDLGRLPEAEACFRRALAINPGHVVVHCNLGAVLQKLARLSEAEASYRQALALQPVCAEAYCNLGGVLKEQGRLTEAQICYRKALEINPDYVEAFSNLLFDLNYTEDYAPSLCFEDARRYGRLLERTVGRHSPAWQFSPPSGRLRVGFVSADLREHPVGYFLEGLLAEINREQIELVAYPTDYKSDSLTARIRPYFSAWKPLSGLSDAAAAGMIRADGVHVLLDLSGHTAHNRLPVFAWRPAPVQASWLGYFATTGVTTMDYLIADPWVLPEAEEQYFTERIWRLPETRLCFSPPRSSAQVSALPALANGHITFGCFNNLTKVNDRVVALWARVLSQVPDSVLYLKAKQLKESNLRQRIAEEFVARGIAADRLILEGPCSREDYLAAYGRVDIALDPFPFPGGTTSVEGLWMGVPVLTLAGDRFLSRQGVGLLMNIGLADWIATDVEDYLSRATAFASDWQRLASLRADLRRRALASPIFDAPRFAANFVEALNGMWCAWCSLQEGEHP